MRKVFIQNAGVLYSEIILTALQEYRKVCFVNGNYSRGDVVGDIINAIEFRAAETDANKI